MSRQLFSFLSAIPLLTTGILLTPIVTKAADIGPIAPGLNANIYGISSIPGGNNGVNVQIIGNTATFDFVPPIAGGFGQYNVDLATGAFSDFAGTNGLIKDIVGLPFPLAPNTPVAFPLPEFLALDNSLAGNDFFDLTNVLGPVFTDIGTGTAVSFGVEGFFRAADGRVLEATGSLSTTFVNLSAAQIIDLASQPGGITTPQSGTFTLRVVDVPEPSTLASLALIGASSLFLGKRKKQI